MGQNPVHQVPFKSLLSWCHGAGRNGIEREGIGHMNMDNAICQCHKYVGEHNKNQKKLAEWNGLPV